VFDVNETLIDIESLAPLFARIFGDGEAFREWFGQLITYSMTVTLANCYVDFFILGQAVLQMMADIRGMAITEYDLRDIAQAMQTMPPHADVADGLSRLRAGGYRLMALTNSPRTPAGTTPLENSGLADLFERQFTVDTSRLFKPSRELYVNVAAELGVLPSSCMMVAAHAWDTIGAQAAGFSAAFIRRSGNAPLPASGVPQPTVIAADLTELVEQLSILKPPLGVAVRHR
jgi:2-haloacid dehalogenase